MPPLHWAASNVATKEAALFFYNCSIPRHTGTTLECPAATLRGSRNRSAKGDVGGLNKYITRSVRGTISISNSSHLLVIVGGRLLNPVALPPGCGKLTTNPLPTGSATCTKTTGMVRVSWSTASVTGVVSVRITSGRVFTISPASFRIASRSDADQ